MKRKICKKCDIEKNDDEFYNGRLYCKICYNEKRRKLYSLIGNEKRKEKYYQNVELSREINRNNKKRQRDKNRTEINIKRRKYYKYKMETDPIFKLKKNVRNRIWKYVRYIGKTKKTFDIIGLTAEELKKHLENQFTDNMTWKNYGDWHIDHRIPLDSAKTKEEVYTLCYYTNLQPMWKNDNIKKGAKILAF
jgi:hypothetical protein